MIATKRKAAISGECTAAESMDWPEMHARCAGNSVFRLPGDPPELAPVQTYSCGCTCHTKGDHL